MANYKLKGKFIRFSKEQMMEAMSKTTSIKSLAKHMGVSYDTAKSYLKYYKHEGKTLYELHRGDSAHSGYKVPEEYKKELSRRGKKKFLDSIPLNDIFEGRVPHHTLPFLELKRRLFEENEFPQRCMRCGYDEKRPDDMKTPLMVSFKNGDKSCWLKKNLEILCYNCYYITIGDVFSTSDETKLQSVETVVHKYSYPKMEITEEMFERLKHLGLMEDEPDPDDPYTLVSRKNETQKTR